jgi:PTS system mannose-specific IID component
MGSVKPKLGQALLRLFTVQGSYNYERMLGLGIGVAEEPLLRDLRDGTDGAYRAAVARAAHFFNAHPYLCGLAVGAAARAEHEGAPPAHVERLRTALCGPLGSLGDRLVWAGWLPLMSALAVVGGALGLGWVSVAVFLVVYNAGHVALRWWALRAGWEYGTRVAAALHHPVLLRAAAIVGPAMAVATGLALPLAAAYLGGLFTGAAKTAVAAGAAVGFLVLRFKPGRVTGLRLGLTFVALALLGGLVWR